jgi:aminoglycoside phosphotransferase (APT) family kinase protein
MDSVDRPQVWTRDDVRCVVDGLAAMHASSHAQLDDLRTRSWLPETRSTAEMVRMTPLWRALRDHAAPLFRASAGERLCAIHARLIDDLPEWHVALASVPQALVHNDFNPRNVCLRVRDGAPTLCAFDWELATLGAPPRDLAEFLCFVLPADVDDDSVRQLVERHRERFISHTGGAIDSEAWHAAFAAALFEILIDRLSVYALVQRVRKQMFLPRVLRTWMTLFAISRTP